MRIALPSDVPSVVALVLGVALAAHGPARRFLTVGSLARFRLGASLLAAALSAAYVAYYLRGGPRIVDATTYYLQARAMSEGHLSWPASDPPSAEMGRFLIRDTLGDAGRVSGIFPPGWPAVLSLGFLIGAPLAIGPLLAFAITWSTIGLARTAAEAAGLVDADHVVPRLAGALSVVCAALRYHTADTMSHGLAAACFVTALAATFELRRAPSARRFAWLAGLALGWLVATRPVSAIACGVACGFALARWPRRREILGAVLGAAPGVALLLVEQHAATGAWLSSSQALYYASSDGPPGCFRYGFGRDIGCRYEHGPFVDRYLPDGFGAWAAIGTTLRRLAMHAVDASNAEPLALVTIGALVTMRARATRALLVAPVALVAAYAPFYFDGSYPGGGARFYADALPVEHVAVALAVARFAAWLGARRGSPIAAARIGALLVGASLLGFAFRAHVDHEQLRDREGGRPMFEPARLRSAGVARGLVFVDTDHGFALGHDPSARADADDVEVVRLRGDLTDRALYDARGRPPTFHYGYDLATGAVSISPFVPPALERVEGETLWPPLSQGSASAWPGYPPAGCAPGSRTLQVFTQAGAGTPTLRLALPGAALAGRRVRVWLGAVTVEQVRVAVDGWVAEPAGLTSTGVVPRGDCVASSWLDVPEGRGVRVLEVSWDRPDRAAAADEAPFSIDGVEVGGEENSR